MQRNNNTSYQPIEPQSHPEPLWSHQPLPESFNLSDNYTPSMRRKVLAALCWGVIWGTLTILGIYLTS